MYTVVYKGAFFFGDTDGYNEYYARDWNDAYELYCILKDCGLDIVYIKEEEFELYYEDGEWY